MVDQELLFEMLVSPILVKLPMQVFSQASMNNLFGWCCLLLLFVGENTNKGDTIKVDTNKG